MGSLARLLGYLRPYTNWVVSGAVLLAVGGALMALVVSTGKPMVNRVLLPQFVAGDAAAREPATPDVLDRVRELLPTEHLVQWAAEHAFIQVPLLIVVIFVLRGAFLYFGNYLTIKAGTCMVRDLRAELYESVAYQSPGFFQTHPTGLLLSRILGDVERLQRVGTTVLADLVRVGVMVPFLLATAFFHDWRMSLVAVVAIPLLGYPTVRLGRRLRRASTASQENMARMANVITESVGGVKVVQGFGMEDYEVARFREALDRTLQADLRAARARSLSPAVLELLGAIVGAVLFFVAGFGIASGRLDPGNFTVVLFSLALLLASFRRLNSLYAEIQGALAASDRVFDVIDREREIRDLPEAEPLTAFEREIRFAGVCFSYGDDAVLEDIDLTIERGQTVALVGPSGSGKSTLALLLPRFYDPGKGRIEIDGRDLRRLTLASLRDRIATVTQETILFDDTVRNNIAYGRADLPLSRVVEAAAAAHAHEFISTLPQGYDTPLGERGARLSMGQRQRLTIARALLKSPPILILDEATSALDAESESLVQQALETLMQGRTSLVIAHRLATVRRADRIVVMESGRIVEQGTHDDLLRRGGSYARLYAMQFREPA